MKKEKNYDWIYYSLIAIATGYFIFGVIRALIR